VIYIQIDLLLIDYDYYIDSIHLFVTLVTSVS